jgi:hypothetical protein
MGDLALFVAARAALAAIALGTTFAGGAVAQPVHDRNGKTSGLRLGAHGTLLGTYATPVLGGEAASEAYLTRPVLTALFVGANGRLRASGTLNLEGWTLVDGELNAGMWGEGFVDRRHPHTFLHELVATGAISLAGIDASLTVGRGFAPFGTDDPMVRPFVKYPVNHHLAQILERWVGIVALRRGPVIVEAGAFNGDEPTSPESLGEVDRFGDSWALRATVLPLAGVEVQASRAYVESPEHVGGRGLDHRKWSASARYEPGLGDFAAYALLEWARTDEYADGRRLYAFGTWLVEGALGRDRWRFAARWERSTRPEEERLLDPFRTVRPHHDDNINGATRWVTWTARAERSVTVGGLSVTPFAEASRITVAEIAGGIFSPTDFYGDEKLWSLSLGARIGVGSVHDRMGRYGLAAPGGTHH